MSEYPNYTLTQLAELILQFETKEGLSPAALANLKEFASSALENASQQSFAPDVAMCEDCGKSPAMEGCSVCAECGL